MSECKKCDYLRAIGRATQETALARRLEIKRLHAALRKVRDMIPDRMLPVVVAYINRELASEREP